jgi:hypothetical protein
MSKSKSLGLSVLFLAISVFVSGSLVLTAREAHAGASHQPSVTDLLHLSPNT